ncbi:MAG: AbrB/MazE/SpoVT family DNA-binding domain-containing protein [Bacilli bacterium]
MNNILLKVDEAGRIIIPLKIRKKYEIDKNDTLLLTTTPNGFKLEKEDIFIKYEKVFSKIKLIEQTFDIDFIVTDNEKIIYTTSKYDKLKNSKISNKLKQILNDNLNSYSEELNITKNFVITSSCFYKTLKLDNYTKGVIIMIFSDKNKKEVILINELLD